MRKFISISLIFLLIFAAFPAASAGDIRITLDGKDLGITGYIENNLTHITTADAKAAFGYDEGIGIDCALREIAHELNLMLDWDGESRTAMLTTPRPVRVDTSAEYEIVNSATGHLLTADGNNITADEAGIGKNQRWNFTPVVDLNGSVVYYYITTPSTEKEKWFLGPALASDKPVVAGVFESGHENEVILCYFGLVSSCVEEGAARTFYNLRRDTPLQRWILRKADPDSEAPAEKSAALYAITSSDGSAISYVPENDMREALTVAPDESKETQRWTLTHTLSGAYIIECSCEFESGDSAEKRCLDVLNHNSDAGVGIIVYRTAGGPNQRWFLEKQEDGSYLIKSELSGYYLTENDGSFTQEELGAEGNQHWYIDIE